MHLVLVEDGARDRELISEALRDRGVQVTALSSDAELYGLLDRKGVRGVDGLVADVNLGQGTTGFDVARAARRYDDRLPVVYITSTDVKGGRHKVEGSVLIRKPQDLTELVDDVLGALGRPGRDRAGSNEAAG